MKLLYSAEYVGRAMFLIEYKEAVIKCYRSSGLSGTGHGGLIIPYSSLNTGHLYTTPGYIFKEMFYHDKWQNHRKEPQRFDGVQEILEKITELVKDEYPEEFQIESVKDILERANKIEDDMNKIINDNSYMFYDLSKGL
jgi:hypothetical protein